MKQHIDMIVMLVVAFLLFTKPNVLVNFVNSTIGRFVLVGAMLFALLHSTLSGVFVAILFVLLSEEVFEGMDNEKAEDAAKERYGEFSKILKLKTEHCKNGKFIVGEKEYTLEEIKQRYPNIKFTNSECNPCDEDCAYSCDGPCLGATTSAVEQLTVMEGFKSQCSRGIAVPERGGNNKKRVPEEE